MAPYGEVDALAYGRPGRVIWLTGLSGAGKSTIANALVTKLISRGQFALTLDGDVLREGLCKDLGFSVADRRENVRRAGELAVMLSDAGATVVVALISPTRLDRDALRRRLSRTRFVEVYVNAPLAVCEARDVKGLYARARRGELKEFTGVSADYEPPLRPSLELRTDELTVHECCRRVLDYIDR